MHTHPKKNQTHACLNVLPAAFANKCEYFCLCMMNGKSSCLFDGVAAARRVLRNWCELSLVALVRIVCEGVVERDVGAARRVFVHRRGRSVSCRSIAASLVSTSLAISLVAGLVPRGWRRARRRCGALVASLLASCLCRGDCHLLGANGLPATIGEAPPCVRQSDVGGALLRGRVAHGAREVALLLLHAHGRLRREDTVDLANLFRQDEQVELALGRRHRSGSHRRRRCRSDAPGSRSCLCGACRRRGGGSGGCCRRG